MNKLKMHSPNLTQENIRKLAELFPNCVTEIKDEGGIMKDENRSSSFNPHNSSLRYALDFDLLRQELSGHIVEGPQERYHLDWPGKREALLAANAPIAKTLRPCREESVDFDTTKNLFIEGDNLDALKLLQETYLGKVKMIYIDPPYNTGNDFIYQDDFAENAEEFLKRSNQKDDEGNRLIANTEANGRFHSDWLSMMYPRLKLARNFLSENGVICISIDDIEKANLRKLLDEVFGAENFLAEMVVLTGANQSGEGVKIQTNTEYCVIYCRDNNYVTINRVDKVDESLRNLNDAPTPLETRPDMGYTIYYNPNTNDLTALHDYDKDRIHENVVEKVYKDDPNLIAAGYVPIRPGFRSNKLHRWRWGIDTFFARIDEIVIESARNGNYVPKFKQSGFNAPKNILQYGSGTTEVSSLFDGNKVFDFPKSQRLISRLIDICSSSDSIVMDFFAGSGSTADAVMQFNKEDGGNRKFIMVQLPEPCDEKSEAFKAGYKTIAEISKERIRRAGKKIKDELGRMKDEETTKGERLKAEQNLFGDSDIHPSSLILPKIHPSSLDVGFRVLKVDSSNMADVYYTPDAIEQGQLKMFTDNIKSDRRPEDLLFQVLLDWGVDLTLPISKKIVRVKKDEGGRMKDEGKAQSGKRKDEQQLDSDIHPSSLILHNSKDSSFIPQPPSFQEFEVYIVDENALVACFDAGVNEELVKELALFKPLRVVFRDTGFASDAVKINAEQIFKQMSPHTEVRSI